MNALYDTPTCEIITIGSELLLGQILDTNTSYLAQELARIGVIIRFRTAVGDQMEEIVQVIRSAVDRCDLVIATGGLGPTLDDLTREAVARAAGVDLEYRQELMDQIEEVFRLAGYQMPENNRRQAFVPQGSQAISNPVGTAPGFIKEVVGKPVICLPGVPRELKYLLPREIIPWVRDRFDLVDHILTYRVLKTAGMGESKVDSLIGDLMGTGKNPEVGLLASMGEIKIRIAAKARDPQEAEALIRQVENEIRSRLGDKIFGQDEDTLEGVINSMLSKRGLTLSILETFTGGIMTHRFCGLDQPRLLESFILNGKDRLSRWLGKCGLPLEGEEAACALAEKIRKMGDTHVGLSVLGFPEKKDKGYALKGCAAATGEGMEKTFSWQMGGDLIALPQRGAVIGLNTLRLALLDRD